MNRPNERCHVAELCVSVQPSVINEAATGHRESYERDRDRSRYVGCTLRRLKYRVNDSILNRLGNSALTFLICVIYTFVSWFKYAQYILTDKITPTLSTCAKQKRRHF